MKTVLRLLIVFMLAAAVGCSERSDAQPPSAPQKASYRLPAGKGPMPWTHTRFHNDPRNFQFAIVSDRTGGHRPGIFGKAVKKLNLLQPEFVISIGDLIEGYTNKADVLNRQWKEFDALVKQLEMPFFYVVGNHDIGNAVMAKKWEQRYGLRYYHFIYQDVLFLCLCTEDPPNSHISDKQVAYAAKVLAENKKARWTCVFMHQPLWTYPKASQVKSNWTKIEPLLKGRKHTVFAGHLHIYSKHVRNDSKYFVLATAGGMSALRGPKMGEMDHVVWVTMTDTGPRIANLLLDGILDENVAKSRTLISALRAAASIEVTPPLRTSEAVFKGAALTVRVTNRAKLPLWASGKFSHSADMSVKPVEFNVAVPPKSGKTIQVKLAPTRPVAVETLSPVVLKWKLTYRPLKHLPISLDGTKRIVVEKVTLRPDGFVDDFSKYAPGGSGHPFWRPVKGTWKIVKGEYHNTELHGYDYFAAADAWIKGDYQLTATVRLIKGIQEGGLLFNMPSAFSKSLSHMVRFSGPTELWCGAFGRMDNYIRTKLVKTGIKAGDTSPITLTVTVHNSRRCYDVAVNGKVLARGLKLATAAPKPGQPRCVGLVSCRGHIAYKQVSLKPIKPATK